LVSAEKVVAILQINGKIKDRIEVSPEITDEQLEAMAMANQEISKELAGAQIKKVITRAPKLVNIVI
jgi:leucyl-tRNA synthetase